LSLESLNRVAAATQRDIIFYKTSLTERKALRDIFSRYPIYAVFHFAGLKSIIESTHDPCKYYVHNVVASLILLECMQEAGVKRMVFSSSATVYGDVKGDRMVREEDQTMPTNVYGDTKLAVENVLRAYCLADAQWRCIILRYVC
jgi:UDP-glucose 4-epimerase